MAKWVIQRENGNGNYKVRLIYHNLLTKLMYDCGSVGSDISDLLVIEWIFNHGTILPGDMIIASNGKVFPYLYGKQQTN